MFPNQVAYISSGWWSYCAFECVNAIKPSLESCARDFNCASVDSLQLWFPLVGLARTRSQAVKFLAFPVWCRFDNLSVRNGFVKLCYIPFVSLVWFIYAFTLPFCSTWMGWIFSATHSEIFAIGQKETMMHSDAAIPSMSSYAVTPSHLEMSGSSHQSADHMTTAAPVPAGGHKMSADDPDNPQNWPQYRKAYVSLVAFAFSWVVCVDSFQTFSSRKAADLDRRAFGATTYTSGISGVVQHLNVRMQVAILGFSLYLLGIAFAPIITPHLSERFGRQAVYLVSFPIFSLFILGASFSHSFGALAVCRFSAGFFGGPSLV